MDSESEAEVLLPMPLDDADTLADILTEERGKKVAVRVPKRGDLRALVGMADRNAKSSFEEKRLTEKANADLLVLTREKLHLSRTPAGTSDAGAPLPRTVCRSEAREMAVRAA